jgi:hypothetical protein
LARYRYQFAIYIDDTLLSTVINNTLKNGTVRLVAANWRMPDWQTHDNKNNGYVKGKLNPSNEIEELVARCRLEVVRWMKIVTLHFMAKYACLLKMDFLHTWYKRPPRI